MDLRSTTTRLALAAALAACGTDHRPDDDVDQPMPDPGADDFTPPADYTRLIGRTWQLDAGANIYKCVRVTVPHDLYITSFVAEAPAGTHHTVLSLAGENGTSGPDGEVDCDASSIGMQMLYASGVGTTPLEFPTDVGVKVAAGQQLHVNLHLTNTGDAPLRGESAIWVKAASTPPPTLAEMVLAGPITFSIPPTNAPHTVSGECTATSPYTLFAVWPHMHTFATQQTVELVTASSTTVLHDEPYRFEHQSYALLEPMPSVQLGDRVRVTCTYVNNSGSAITYGDAANQEMCFAGLYRYPAVGSNQFCAE